MKLVGRLFCFLTILSALLSGYYSVKYLFDKEKAEQASAEEGIIVSEGKATK
ncbi:hypothetical protein V9K67_21720 [Paraflavisolibacter sp. H34]|uniref:hypothetical protein n=1 Tax=Huijunlia imazamoxiresistens TaxID=3127457 RepID=UPI00301828FF